MIKILKEGKIKHTATCEECECVFEFEAEDVLCITRWDDHGGHYPVCDVYEIKCPFCGWTISLSGSNFTPEEKTKMEHKDD